MLWRSVACCTSANGIQRLRRRAIIAARSSSEKERGCARRGLKKYPTSRRVFPQPIGIRSKPSGNSHSSPCIQSNQPVVELFDNNRPSTSAMEHLHFVWTPLLPPPTADAETC